MKGAVTIRKVEYTGTREPVEVRTAQITFGYNAQNVSLALPVPGGDTVPQEIEDFLRDAAEAFSEWRKTHWSNIASQR